MILSVKCVTVLAFYTIEDGNVKAHFFGGGL